MEHVCTNKLFCWDAIEDEITGLMVCRFSGKVFTELPPLSVEENVEKQEEKQEDEKEKIVVEEYVFHGVLRQVVLNAETFPLEAYAYELKRLYTLHKLYRKFVSIEEYVLSTLYMMCEGYGEVCEPNLFLTKNILKQTELKSVKIDKTLITTGNKHWNDIINIETNHENKNHGFVLKRLKLSANNVSINNHQKILNIYDTIKTYQNKYLIDL